MTESAERIQAAEKSFRLGAMATAAAGNQKLPGISALQWLLAQPGKGRSGKHELDQRLRQARDW